MPVHVCCMFFVSQKIHIKQSPNAIKTHGDFFGIYVIIGKKNQHETMPEESTRKGRAPRGRARPGPSWPLYKEVGALVSPQESQYPDKNRVQISAQSEFQISGNLRNGERPETKSTRTEGNRERDSISEG